MKTSKPRDEFLNPVKEALAARAGYHCSFPSCHAKTIGPSSETSVAVSNTGNAAHIIAASTGRGARRARDVSPEVRRSIENGIWMCATHATLIDDDEVRFTIPMLETWKSLAEYRARLEQSSGRQIELDATKTTEYGLVAESLEILPQEAYSQKIGDAFSDCCVREMWGRSVASAVRDAVIELTMNALTHGGAKRARITFSFAEIELSDDGGFFDPQTLGQQSRTGGGAETIAQLQTRLSQHLLVTHKFKNGRNSVSFSYKRSI